MVNLCADSAEPVCMAIQYDVHVHVYYDLHLHVSAEPSAQNDMLNAVSE